MITIFHIVRVWRKKFNNIWLPKNVVNSPFALLYKYEFTQTRPPMFRDFPQTPWLFKIMKCALGTSPLSLHTLPLREGDRTSALPLSGKVYLIIRCFSFQNGSGFFSPFLFSLQGTHKIKSSLQCLNQIIASASTKITANNINYVFYSCWEVTVNIRHWFSQHLWNEINSGDF